MSIALLIIDMQKEFKTIEHCKRSINEALEYINEASDMFRKAKRPVIIIQDEETDDGPGSGGFELMEELVTNLTDHYITKTYSNAFWKTDLESLLHSLDIEFVVISGFAAEHCVLFSLNGALERGFGASVLQNGIAGFNEEIIKQTQLCRPVISLESLEYMLKKLS
ncbi:cysteine hydrolase family protein [Vallitalea okinawensis]|uniref:cysteine hydrolase family protein n=1 Tax=Vallitalea okinawensis TaxID=2078660 RepID=UPI0014790068|nr:isochorismatase family cysteine hydrolase [Vallitalea okinawensis]